MGSYTSAAAPNAPGEGEGVAVFRQDAATGALRPVGAVDPAVDPSYLALHPDGRTVYAVSEAADGQVWAYRFDPADGALTRLGESRSTHGSAPCHLSVDPSGRWLAVANYSSGTVSLHPLGADGAVGEAADVARHEGSGPVTERQEGPHAHMAVFLPGRGTVDGHAVLHVTDLGLDQVITYHVDLEKGALIRASAVRLEPGTGPRHLVHHASGATYVAGELDTSVTVLRRSLTGDGVLEVVGKVPAVVGERPPANEENWPSAIRLSPCQRYLYVANRGRDVVGVFRVGADGMPVPVEDAAAGGPIPREIGFVGKWFYAGAQLGGVVTAFDVDADTGALTSAGVAAEVGSPVALLAVPGRA
ncbi:hypothetical protein BIV57_04980 [Mangrovactinospora gilvigrisea]|uniref:6-phosphogluconolactonase n=1 Tax=Mangrovactinospora gilvigrisea TaxID=1428644 RepID=A0A1J7CAR1_9ACTN|nr:hypothetical protein BIV57_04980 [Mangrovactinospora gilvigrisea]